MRDMRSVGYVEGILAMSMLASEALEEVADLGIGSLGEEALVAAAPRACPNGTAVADEGLDELDVDHALFGGPWCSTSLDGL